MGDYTVNYDASQRMSGDHVEVAEDIEDLASTVVTSLDGGEGTEFILNGLAAISEAAGEVAQVNRSAADRLRVMVDRVKGVDADAESDFRDLERTID